MSDERGTTAVTEAAGRETAASISDPERLGVDLQYLGNLLEQGRVEEARHVVKQLEQRWPEAERVRHYAQVLAPPKARLRPDVKPRSLEQEWKWLEEHGHEYPGYWLAIREDRLVAADPDRQVVLDRVREALGDE